MTVQGIGIGLLGPYSPKQQAAMETNPTSLSITYLAIQMTESHRNHPHLSLSDTSEAGQKLLVSLREEAAATLITMLNAMLSFVLKGTS